MAEAWGYEGMGYQPNAPGRSVLPERSTRYLHGCDPQADRLGRRV